MPNVTLEDLLAHPLARGMRLHAKPREFAQAMLDFLSTPERLRRMEEAEVHHDRPALAGVILELEIDLGVQQVAKALGQVAFGRAIGAVVQILLEQKGWRKTGRKGAVAFSSGTRPGLHMQRSERYAPPESHPGFQLWLAHHSPEDGWKAGLTRRESIMKVPASGSLGRTGAQEMRDIFLAAGVPDTAFAGMMAVLPKTVRAWLRQARVDGGEAEEAGRAIRPSAEALERARKLLVKNGEN